MSLIRQVLESTSVVMGNTEGKIEEDMNRWLAEKDSELNQLNEERKITKNDGEVWRNRLREEQNRKQGFFESIFFPNSQEMEIKVLQYMSEVYKFRLDSIKYQYDKVRQEMENAQNNRDYWKILSTDEKDIQVIDLLKIGLKELGGLHKQWARVTRHFHRLDNFIESITSRNMKIFTEDATDAANNESLFEFLDTYIMTSFQSSYLTYRIAGMYVKVSSRYIIDNLAGMQELISMDESQASKAMKKLKESCEEASVGISVIIGDEKKHLIETIENHNDKIKEEITILQDPKQAGSQEVRISRPEL